MLRTWIVFGLFVLLFTTISVRLFFWQVISGAALRAQAATQYSQSLVLPASRGSILATDSSPLVMNQPGYLVYAKPREIEKKDSFASALVRFFSLNEASLASRLSEPGRLWLPIANKIDEKTKVQLEKQGLVGLGFEKEPKRYYPEASMAAHLLGFVGKDENGNDKGYFGLEGYYDRQLRGRDGSLVREQDASGVPILLGDPKRVDPENGRNLSLWLDKSVQRIIEQRLLEGINKYGAKEGMVVVMDPHTGGILGMASYPNYSPSDYSQFNHDLFKNPVVASSYEPGSTFKVLVMAAALDKKVVALTTTMDERGPVDVGEYMIRTWNDSYHGTLSMSQILQYSSNVGMVFVGNKLGKEKLLRAIGEYGFGEVTGVDLQEEETPDLRDSQHWTDIDLATATFGQGIAVTPLQMVRAVGALANGGWLMEPQVVRSLTDEKGKKIEKKPKKVRQVVGESTAKILTEMMVFAVDNGEAKWAKPKGYRIAGKTGTAQIPVSGHYDDKKTIASFIGFAPADNPRFVMLVTLREPSSSQWGSETAAPLYFSIAKDLFLYYGIPTSE